MKERERERERERDPILGFRIFYKLKILLKIIFKNRQNSKKF
jgi:hypothetical protein